MRRGSARGRRGRLLDQVAGAGDPVDRGRARARAVRRRVMPRWTPPASVLCVDVRMEDLDGDGRAQSCASAARASSRVSHTTRAGVRRPERLRRAASPRPRPSAPSGLNAGTGSRRPRPRRRARRARWTASRTTAATARAARSGVGEHRNAGLAEPRRARVDDPSGVAVSASTAGRRAAPSSSTGSTASGSSQQVDGEQIDPVGARRRPRAPRRRSRPGRPVSTGLRWKVIGGRSSPSAVRSRPAAARACATPCDAELVGEQQAGARLAGHDADARARVRGRRTSRSACAASTSCGHVVDDHRARLREGGAGHAPAAR